MSSRDVSAFQRLIDRFGPRGLSIALAIVLEVLLILMLLTLGSSIVGTPEPSENLTSVDIQASPPRRPLGQAAL